LAFKEPIMADIKAIETVYNGYRFRSRLEARWAVFYDTVGIRYEYEKEGYELPSGRYLPDFYLPDQDAFAEIKAWYSATDRDRSVALELSDATHKPVYIFEGNCWWPHDDTEGYICSGFHPERGVARMLFWAQCPNCSYMGLSYGGDVVGLACGCEPFDLGSQRRLWACPGWANELLSRGYKAARQARFEYGERG
jgi:hypothetical protein